jgi:hypothetical protein
MFFLSMELYGENISKVKLHTTMVRYLGHRWGRFRRRHFKTPPTTRSKPRYTTSPQKFSKTAS